MEDRVRHGFRVVLARTPQAADLRVLMAGFERARSGYAANPAAAAEYLKVGESRPGMEFATVELAAYTVVAGTLLNLDETVTRE